ncbi:MAG: glycosyltransferase domain-containing protein [Gammaproteobacteria bacterium]|jgi:glycosyltransferase domain-containing protein
MDYPLVTIGIPTYNRANSFEQALKSALAQDYENLEIIISDNASTDETEQTCNRLITNRENVSYIRQKENRGPTENFRTVANNAKGKYFMWLGDDDWLDENYISSCVEKILSSPDASIVGGTPKYYINNKYVYSGIHMDITSNSAAQRVRTYFLQVKHNGIFYGLMPSEMARSKPLRNVLGADLLFVASVVFSGKAHTVDNTSIHRRRGGVSSQNKKLVKSMGLSWVDAYLPRISAARYVFDYIMTDNSFASLSKTSRYLLALQCVTLAAFRKVASVILPRHFVEQSYKAPKAQSPPTN